MPTIKEQLIVVVLLSMISIAGLYAIYRNWDRIWDGINLVPSTEEMRRDRDARVEWCQKQGGTARLNHQLLFEGCTLPPRDR